VSGTIIYSSRGDDYAHAEIGLIRTDGTGERYVDLDIPGQTSWSAGPVFSDGHRMVLHSVEDERTWEHKSVSHLWIYDIEQDRVLTEIASDMRPADFMPPGVLLPGDERIVINPIVDGKQCIVSMNLDGSDLHYITTPDQGFSYAIVLSPDATKVAFHVAGPPNYFVVVTNLDGSDRRVIAMDQEHIYFGPVWSSDGEWLLFQECHSPTDPEHFQSDLCISRPDGSDFQVVTSNRSQWFAAAYGNLESRSSGSNMPRWRPNQPVCTYTRLHPDSQTAWRHDPNPSYDDHFNRNYHPEDARGGCQICLLNPYNGEIVEITPYTERNWDFRTAWSNDGDQLVFCRARVGEPPELWIMDADGGNARFLTRGKLGLGADHPGWA
jgi:Tol biopolymer transport system component